MTPAPAPAQVDHQRQVTCIGSPQVVGIDVMLVDNCQGHQHQQAAPSIGAIAIASNSPRERALDLLAPQLDQIVLNEAIRSLWADVNVAKVMFAVHRAAVAWYSFVQNHLAEVGDNVEATKTVDIQLLYEHAFDTTYRDVTVLQLAIAAKLDNPAEQMKATSFGFKAMAQVERKSHNSCTNEAVPLIQQQLVQTAQLFALIYFNLRLIPLPIGTVNASVVDAKEWKSILTKVTLMTADRCVNAVVNKGAVSIWFDKRADYQLRSLECLSARVKADCEDSDNQELLLLPQTLECDIDPL